MKDFIAIFDSGIGGLTVYDTIKKDFPNESIVYLADTKNCPYGTKTLEKIKDISLMNINYLKKLGAKIIIIACNTATSSVIDEIKASDGYIIGVIEPTANLALQTSKSKKIGLFATNLTVQTQIYQKFLKNSQVSSVGCSDFVLPIENGDIHSQTMRNLIKKHIQELDDVDTLILGCTHFPYIKEEIQLIIPDVKLVESGTATSKEVAKYLPQQSSLNHQKTQHCFLTTGNITNVLQQLERLNQHFDKVEQITIE